MIPIKADQNTDFGDGDGKDNTENGYLYINNNHGSSNTSWEDVRGLQGSGINHNPNRYIISVTSLTNDNYIIGDPRNPNITDYSSASDIEEDSKGHELDYYHATEQGDRTQKMISPEFMVASSYGFCQNDFTYEDAVKRCATYQEDGYPAGRWRVATEAEIRYIIQLSLWNIIPELFSRGISYWSVHGKITLPSNNNTPTNGGLNGNARVRCVYDTWRWGTERVDRKTFTYGDEEKL